MNDNEAAATTTAASRTRRRPSVVVSRRGMKFARGLGWVSQRAGVVQHQSARGKRDERGSSPMRKRGERRIEGAGDRERERENASE